MLFLNKIYLLSFSYVCLDMTGSNRLLPVHIDCICYIFVTDDLYISFTVSSVLKGYSVK